jgi:hypothetical protein
MRSNATLRRDVSEPADDRAAVLLSSLIQRDSDEKP